MLNNREYVTGTCYQDQYLGAGTDKKVDVFVRFTCMGAESVDVCENPPSVVNAGAMGVKTDDQSAADAAAGPAPGKMDLKTDASFDRDELEYIPWYDKPYVKTFLLFLIACPIALLVFFLLMPADQQERLRQGQFAADGNNG